MLRFLLVEAAQVTVRSLPEWRSNAFPNEIPNEERPASMTPIPPGDGGCISFPNARPAQQPTW
jgi:hypothetical protein